VKLKLCLTLLSLIIIASVLTSQQLPRSQMPDLGRTTKADDEVPLFDFDNYFNGKWTFEWEVPDGILGPAGQITGSTVYRPVDGRFYEADTEATGAGGPFKIKELIAYYRENKTLARYVNDSRGLSYMQIGRIGGDLGGYYTVYFEGSPVVYKGKSIRIKSTMRLLSPLNYKVETTVSTNDGRFMSYGTPWWRKQVAGINGR